MSSDKRLDVKQLEKDITRAARRKAKAELKDRLRAKKDSLRRDKQSLNKQQKAVVKAAVAASLAQVTEGQAAKTAAVGAPEGWSSRDDRGYYPDIRDGGGAWDRDDWSGDSSSSSDDSFCPEPCPPPCPVPRPTPCPRPAPCPRPSRSCQWDDYTDDESCYDGGSDCPPQPCPPQPYPPQPYPPQPYPPQPYPPQGGYLPPRRRRSGVPPVGTSLGGILYTAINTALSTYATSGAIGAATRSTIAAAASQYAAQRAAQGAPYALDAQVSTLISGEITAGTATDAQIARSLGYLSDALSNPLAPAFVIGTLSASAGLTVLDPTSQQQIMSIMQAVLAIDRSRDVRSLAKRIINAIYYNNWPQAQLDIAAFVPVYLYSGNPYLI